MQNIFFSNNKGGQVHALLRPIIVEKLHGTNTKGAQVLTVT